MRRLPAWVCLAAHGCLDVGAQTHFTCDHGVAEADCTTQCTIPEPYGHERDCGYPGVKVSDCSACDDKGPDPARCKAVGCCYGGGSATVPSCFFGKGQWPPPSGTGVSLVAVLAVAGLVYIGGGVVLGSRATGKPLTAQVHPHWGRWQQLAALCADGVAHLSGGRGRAARQQYTKVGSDAQPHDRSPGGKQQKKAKKEKTEKGRSRRSAEPAEGEGGSRATEAPRTASAAATPSGTVAGDGGRWVHVPN